MDPLRPPAEAHHVIEAEGEAFVWQARPGVLVEKGSGLLTLGLAHCYTDFFDTWLEPGKRAEVFGDFEKLTHYTREAREHLSQFSLAHLPALKVVHFLIASKFVAFGLSSYKSDIGDE